MNFSSQNHHKTTTPETPQPRTNMASSSSTDTPIKIVLKFTTPAPPRPPAHVNLTPTDVKNLVGALSNTKDDIKIDYEGMKQTLGLSSKSSASKIWSRLRKKLFANLSQEEEEASATSDEAAGDDDDDDDDIDDDNEGEDKVPAKKRAAAKRGRETEDGDGDDGDGDVAGEMPGKKARKST